MAEPKKVLAKGGGFLVSWERNANSARRDKVIAVMPKVI